MKLQVKKMINAFRRHTENVFCHKRIIIFKQLRALRWPDMLTLFGLLCVSFSVYYSFKGYFIIAYILILAQLFFDYFDGKLARAIGGGVLGVYLDSFSDFMAVASSVVFGWFAGITGIAMLLAGFLNIGAAFCRGVAGLLPRGV